jgi:hypothetical protein
MASLQPHISLHRVNYVIPLCIFYIRFALPCNLKGHGNEADFLGILQKLVPHRSLTLPFELFRFWLQIRGDIRNQKTTPRLGKSVSCRLSDSASRRLSDSASRRLSDSASGRLPDSAFECLKENSASQRVGDSPSRRVGESL